MAYRSEHRQWLDELEGKRNRFREIVSTILAGAFGLAILLLLCGVMWQRMPTG